MKSEKISADAVRFIIGGLVNTAFTYGPWRDSRVPGGPEGET